MPGTDARLHRALPWILKWKRTVDDEGIHDRHARNSLAARAALAVQPVWRGQRCTEAMQSRLPTLCFGDRETASLYAIDPNDRTAVDTHSDPVVFPAVLHARRVFAPWAPGNGDPFLDIEDVAALFGRAAARRLVAELEGTMRDTGAWEELSQAHPFASPLDAFDAWPETCPFLPPAQMYQALLCDWFVEILRAHGYDAVLTGGAGMNALEDEWHVLDQDIVELGFAALRRQARHQQMLFACTTALREAAEIPDPWAVAPDLEFIMEADEIEDAAWRMADVPLELVLRDNDRPGDALPGETAQEAAARWKTTRDWMAAAGPLLALDRCPVILEMKDGGISVADGWHRCVLAREEFGLQAVRALVRVESWPAPECKGPGDDPGP